MYLEKNISPTYNHISKTRRSSCAGQTLLLCRSVSDPSQIRKQDRFILSFRKLFEHRFDIFCVLCKMSLDLNDAAMSGNLEEVIIRLNMGEDPNQKFYPR